MSIPSHSFEATKEQLESNIEQYIDDFISGLQSFFMVMPKGKGFIDFHRFQKAYQVLRSRTNDFKEFSAENAVTAAEQDPLVLVILRTMLGFSPPEFAYMAELITGIKVDQSSARRIDKRAREGKSLFHRTQTKTQEQVKALIRTAVQLITQGAPKVGGEVIHRLYKIDTEKGLINIKQLAKSGVPYEMLLYERFLGRPFATHRDTVSEKVGDVIENAVREILDSQQIPYHKTLIAERFEDMDQAPDFLIPNKVSPVAVIEAKLAEDDGTARDKVTRVQHLAELRDQRHRRGQQAFEVIACIDGRGFGIRREDVRKLLIATEGKLFTLQTIDNMVENTALKKFSRRERYIYN